MTSPCQPLCKLHIASPAHRWGGWSRDAQVFGYQAIPQSPRHKQPPTTRCNTTSPCSFLTPGCRRSGGFKDASFLCSKNGEKSQNCPKSSKKHMPGMCVHISLLGRGVIYIYLLALLVMSVLHNSPHGTNWSQRNSEQGRLLWRWKTSRWEVIIFFNARARGTLGGRGHRLQHTDRRMSAAQRNPSWGTGSKGWGMWAVQGGIVVSVGFRTAHADQLKPSSFPITREYDKPPNSPTVRFDWKVEDFLLVQHGIWVPWWFGETV